jgi:hypothetical protein
MSKGIIVSPANRGVQVVVTDENNVQLLVDSNRGVNLEIVPQPRIEVLVDKGVEGAQGPVGPQGPQGPQGTAATVTAGTTTTGAAGTNAIVTNSGTSSAAVFDFTIPRGDTGATGATGAGVATGGTTGQVLVKASNVNYDTTWATITGTLVYQGSWNASTNTPTLTSSVGTNGYYYVVGTSGSTNLNGITDWVVGDWAIFNGSVWQKIDNTDLVSSVNGQTGVVVLNAADVGAFPATPTTGSGNVVLDTAPTLNNPTISNYEAFTPSSVPSYVEGRTWYDSNRHALAYYNDSPNDVVHIGQDLIVKVINNTGSTIPNGSPVYITSTSSGQSYPNIALAKADVAATSAVIGLTNGSIANGAIGYVTSQGGIDNVNTSTFSVGQVLYLSPYSAGQLMNTLPPTGITVQVGVVQYVNSSTGIIYVKQTTPLSVPASIITGTLPIANGGTGATTASGARTNLGLGTIATQDASNVAITGGTIDNTVIGGTTPAAGTFTTLTGGGGSANYFQTQGSATTKAIELKALGSDSNIAFVIDSKGTGAIDLAAGSSGVNISNGGTVTALTRTAQGSGYTSTPSVAITAPTTAGGVQATATALMIAFGNSPTITLGGTGYTVNDVLTVSGGTFASAVTITVTSVSGGVITGANYANFGNYTVLPSNPVSVTGGTGSSATFTISWGVNAYTITNAGSGYVEQPIISFSGGGGSGAAAYATVGSGATLKSLGSTFNVYVDNSSGRAFQFYNSGGTTDNFWSAAAGGSSPFLYAQGSTNTTGRITSNGTGSISIYTNGGAQQQCNVAHTASAVNFVQVTGAATTGQPVISAQGSDTNIGLRLQSKGDGTIYGVVNSSTAFDVYAPASSVNYIRFRANATAVAPVVQSFGSDTNIPLVLQPKGTGALQAQQTDSTATGGNARGANAVDWQTGRGSASAVASGANAFIGSGYSNTASGSIATVGGGQFNISSGTLSGVFGGYANTASGSFSGIASGSTNTAAGILNFIGGGFTNSGTSNSSVTNQSGTMNGTTAVTLSGSNASIKVGQYITGTSIASDTYVAAISGTSLTLSKVASGSSTNTLFFFAPHGVVVGGGNNQATGSYSFIGGGGDAGTAANRNVASGDWSTVGGGVKNVASGVGSVVAGGGYIENSIFGNTASGSSSFIGSGVLNVASGIGAVISGGWQNTANSTLSTVVGGRFGTTRATVGMVVLPACSEPIAAAIGVSQAGVLILARQTTDATPTVLRSDVAAASTTNQVILPNNSAYTFRGEIVSGVTGGGNSKSWTIEGLIKRGANAASTTLVGSTVTSNFADAGASTWTIALSADTTNGGLAVTFTGQASTTIRTVCQIRTTEMTY